MKNKKQIVLIIEDNKKWQIEIQHLLESFKVKFLVASTIAEGLNIAKEFSKKPSNLIDLVILDMRIPFKKNTKTDHKGGIKFIKLQLYNFFHNTPPIIFFTAYPNYDQCIEAIKDGAYYYLPKSSHIPGVNNSERLMKMCGEILCKEKIKAKHKKQPDEGWFKRNHMKVRERYSKKYVAFVATDKKLKILKPIKMEKLDGVKILISNTYEKLRQCIIEDEHLINILPLIVYIEGGIE